jgi:hypothetical protein
MRAAIGLAVCIQQVAITGTDEYLWSVNVIAGRMLQQNCEN